MAMNPSSTGFIHAARPETSDDLIKIVISYNRHRHQHGPRVHRVGLYQSVDDGGSPRSKILKI
jgi:hypothetical protein